MYSKHNEEKSVVAERFIRTLKNKIYKHITSVSRDVYIDKLDEIVNEYNNICHRTTSWSVNIKYNTCINFDGEVNDKNSKLKVGDNVRISKYKKIFAKGCTPNWSEEVSVVKKVKSKFPLIYINNDLNGEEIIRTFDEKELQKTNQKGFRTEK